MAESDNETPFYEIDGEEFCDHEEALADLLRAGILFVGELKYDRGEHDRGKTCCLFMLCSDTFAWGGADAEDLPVDQVGPLWKAHKACPKWGSTRWVCSRRGMQPQSPIRRDMKRDGDWDDAMAALDPNSDDRPQPPR